MTQWELALKYGHFSLGKIPVIVDLADLGCLLFLICTEFVYLYFPVLFCLSVSVK